MPTPHPRAVGPALTRRTALATLLAGAAAGLAGCTDEPDPTGSEPGEGGGRPPLDPDVTLAGLALRGVQEVLAALEATAARHPRLAVELRPLARAHRAHLDLLEDAAPDDVPSRSPNPLEAPTGSPSGPGLPPPPPASPRRAMAALAEAETTLSTRLGRHAFVAQSGKFARLLASMSAASAQHAAVLGGVDAPANRGQEQR